MATERKYIQVNFGGSQVDNFENIEAYKRGMQQEKSEAIISWDKKLVEYIENKYREARVFEVMVTSKEIIF